MLRKLLSAAIGAYQKYIKVFLPGSCRFVPSCSEYTKDAVIKYGAIRGLWLGFRRILRCSSYSRRSGDDPLV